jgi:type II secretory pathway component HofQ
MAAQQIYDLTLDLSMGGKPISSSRILVSEGETASVETKGTSARNYIEVLPKEGKMGGREGILISFKIGKVDKFGKRTIISKPRILARENIQASIKQSLTGNKKQTLVVSVVAKRRRI